jgi:hypothetical protein
MRRATGGSRRVKLAILQEAGMVPGARRGIAVVAALLAAGAVVAAEDLAARVERAEAAAKANAATTQGREWIRRNSASSAKLLMPTLNKCLPDDGDIPTVFAIYVRLSQKGRVVEAVTELDEDLGACLTSGSAATQFPAPPRDGYWIQLNMAADL